jgi:hypothetical protein
MFVAFVALIVAFQGSAMADTVAQIAGFKTNSIPGSAIKNGSITGKKIGAQQITTTNLVPHTLNGRDIKLGSIGGNLIAPDSVTGANVDESTLATVPDAAKLGGKPASEYQAAGVVIPIHGLTLTDGQEKVLATSGPLSVVASCTLDAGSNTDKAATFVRTTADHSAMDANDQWNDFGPLDQNVAFGSSVSTSHGSESLEANDQGVAVAPDGSMIATPGLLAAVNQAAFPGKCLFAGELTVG